MASDDQELVFKTKKIVEEGAHGGAWKIAYADFVTAMMAFFLLLWLLNATEDEQLKGVSAYFTPTFKRTADPSGSGGMFGGITSSEPGPEERKLHTAADMTTPRDQGSKDSTEDGTGSADEESTGSSGRLDPVMEQQLFYGTKNLMEAALDKLPPELKNLEQSIQIEVNDNGLEIKIIDQERHPIFRKQSPDLTKNGEMLLKFVAQYGARLPNPVSISGHTDGKDERPLAWKLSGERANAARRKLQRSGISPRKFEVVAGRGSSQLLNPSKPGAPENRRVIVVFKRQQINKFTGQAETQAPTFFNSDEAPHLQ